MTRRMTKGWILKQACLTVGRFGMTGRMTKGWIPKQACLTVGRFGMTGRRTKDGFQNKSGMTWDDKRVDSETSLPDGRQVRNDMGVGHNTNNPACHTELVSVSP